MGNHKLKLQKEENRILQVDKRRIYHRTNRGLIKLLNLNSGKEHFLINMDLMHMPIGTKKPFTISATKDFLEQGS